MLVFSLFLFSALYNRPYSLQPAVSFTVILTTTLIETVFRQQSTGELYS